MALSEKTKRGLFVTSVVVALVAAIVALGVAVAVYGTRAAAPDRSTMTVCRSQYGTCTEATR